MDLDPNFVLALELKVLKLEGLSYAIRPSIYILKGWYDETPPKVAVTVIVGVMAFLPPPRVETLFWNVMQKRVKEDPADVIIEDWLQGVKLKNNYS